MVGGNQSLGNAILSNREILQVGLVTLCMLVAHWTLRDSSLEVAANRIPRSLLIAGWTFMSFLIILNQGNGNAFIYFQF